MTRQRVLWFTYLVLAVAALPWWLNRPEPACTGQELYEPSDRYLVVYGRLDALAERFLTAHGVKIHRHDHLTVLEPGGSDWDLPTFLRLSEIEALKRKVENDNFTRAFAAFPSKTVPRYVVDFDERGEPVRVRLDDSLPQTEPSPGFVVDGLQMDADAMIYRIWKGVVRPDNSHIAARDRELLKEAGLLTP